jgi:hypothetical protein
VETYALIHVPKPRKFSRKMIHAIASWRFNVLFHNLIRFRGQIWQNNALWNLSTLSLPLKLPQRFEVGAEIVGLMWHTLYSFKPKPI